MKNLIYVSMFAVLAGAAPSPEQAASAPVPEAMAEAQELDADADTVAADDPLIASGSSALVPLALPLAGTWLENATRLYYDSAILLAWRSELGDYAPAVLGSAPVPDTNLIRRVTIAVPARNDFLLKSSEPGGDHAYYASREAADPAQRPALIVNGTDRFEATRDTYLSTRSTTPVGTSTQLVDRDAMLIAFDGYEPRAGDSVQLQLTTTKQYGDHDLRVYAPDIRFELPVIDAPLDPAIVSNAEPADLRPRPNYRVVEGVGVATISGTDKTFLNTRLILPPAGEYVMTTVMQLGTDWPDAGGKLPGLANTGQALNTGGRKMIIDGINCNNAGWGGRPANGCRWSARTGFRGRSGDRVGLATYFYALDPSNDYGWSDPWPMSVNVGRWFAIVQRVKVNNVGEADGRLSYWLCADSGCFPTYDRKDIRWRAADLQEALLSEAWIDVFCGGSKCGKVVPLPTATYRLKRTTVTRGLPDLGALEAEVRTLNGD